MQLIFLSGEIQFICSCVDSSPCITLHLDDNDYNLMQDRLSWIEILHFIPQFHLCVSWGLKLHVKMRNVIKCWDLDTTNLKQITELHPTTSSVKTLSLDFPSVSCQYRKHVTKKSGNRWREDKRRFWSWSCAVDTGKVPVHCLQSPQSKCRWAEKRLNNTRLKNSHITWFLMLLRYSARRIHIIVLRADRAWNLDLYSLTVLHINKTSTVRRWEKRSKWKTSIQTSRYCHKHFYQSKKMDTTLSYFVYS